MKVAVLVKEFPPNVIGGTETQTMRMASSLQSRGHEVTVYTKSYGSETPSDEHAYSVVRVPNLRIFPFVSTLTFVLCATVLLLWDANDYDVLQCMMVYPTGFVGHLVSRVRGLPYFAWIRGGDYYFMKDTPGKRFTIARVLADTLVLCQSERIATDVRREFTESRLEVLGNGVDLPDDLASGDRVVFVGRLADWKGVDVLLRALDGTDIPAVVVGDGPERERLETLADDLAVDAAFTGFVAPDEVPAYLRRGRVFVLPSTGSEGLPNAMLEAMAHGLPVVVTDSGGTADVVADGESGFVVPKGDPGALRDRIERLYADDDLHVTMSENARAYVEENHSWDVICATLEGVYERVVTDARS